VAPSTRDACQAELNWPACGGSRPVCACCHAGMDVSVGLLVSIMFELDGRNMSYLRKLHITKLKDTRGNFILLCFHFSSLELFVRFSSGHALILLCKQFVVNYKSLSLVL
jgi:hypothetical protein